jgi:hypothetical protein
MLYSVVFSSWPLPCRNHSVLVFALQIPWQIFHVPEGKSRAKEIMPQASGSISYRASVPSQTSLPDSRSFRVHQGHMPEVPLSESIDRQS